MTDSPFQTAAKGALPAFYATGGELVTLTRGSITAEDVGAVRSRVGTDALETEGVYTRVGRLEFLIHQADYEFGAGAVEPQRGDTIADSDGVEYDVQDDFEPLEQSGEWRIPVVKVEA